jgi:ketosteroid isomerase-like protein
MVPGTLVGQDDVVGREAFWYSCGARQPSNGGIDSRAEPDLTDGKPVLTREKVLLAAAIVLLIWDGFAFGVVSDLRLERNAATDNRLQNLHQTGDAPSQVRMEVLAALRAFQEGYRKRDAKELNSFMHDLFLENDDILLLGTDPDEWMRGYRKVSEFIRQDWEKWGGFRFAVDDSIVWSSGDVAWIVSVGSVLARGADRRVRFSATLKRSGDRWRFRQLQFQWDDPGPRLSDLFRPRTHVRLAGLVSEYVRTMVRYHLR